MSDLTDRLRAQYAQPPNSRRKPGAGDIYLLCRRLDAIEKLVRQDYRPYSLAEDRGAALRRIEARLAELLK